jgi:excisionase family DNA binding protein
MEPKRRSSVRPAALKDIILAVPRAAQLLGISRAAAYRLVAAGELPVRRLGGRVYVVTAGLRDLVA